MAGQLVVLPFASIYLYLVESQYPVSVSHVVFELALIAETVGVVKNTVSMFYVSFSLAIVFQLGFAVSHAEFVVVVGVLKHFIQIFLVIWPLAFYFTGCARSIVSAGFPFLISTFALFCGLFYLRTVLSGDTVAGQAFIKSLPELL